MFGFDAQQRRILHLTWVAFFLTFVAWFNLAPFNTVLIAQGLTLDEVRVLMIANVALTIPARIVIGSLVDLFGPRRVFSGILLYTAAVSFFFACASTFSQFLVSRLLMGIAGAGFVVGIKMISGWFPHGKMGTAQGLYAGWGNFGAAAAAFTLAPLAGLFSLDIGWRVAAGFSGALCLVWAAVYFRLAPEMPKQSGDVRFGLQHSVEVTSRQDIFLQLLALLPVYGALGLLLWKLNGILLFMTTPLVWGMGILLLLLYTLNGLWCFKTNSNRLRSPVPEAQRYAFKQIFILSGVYALTFGSELAVVSMFPEFLETTFALSVTIAGVLGSCFAFSNLVTRPAGGWLSDHFGRRRVLFFLVAGSAICYWLMGGITSTWPLTAAVGLALVCSVLIQAGNGACFALVPLIRRDLTGQLAGLAGAYGNVGAVFFLTALSLTEATTFFYCIAAYALVVTISLLFLDSFEQPRATTNSQHGA